MMLVFKDKNFSQKFNEFSYKVNINIIGGKHGGRTMIIIGETTWKVNVCFPDGSISTLEKCDLQGDGNRGTVVERTAATTENVEVVSPNFQKSRLVHAPNIDPEISERVNLTNRGGLGGLETDTLCALCLLMVSFERKGISPTSTDAYKVFQDFAENHSKKL